MHLKHIRQPWKIVHAPDPDPDAPDDYEIMDADGNTVCVVNNIACAQLIANAPDMFDSLEALAESVRQSIEGPKALARSVVQAAELLRKVLA